MEHIRQTFFEVSHDLLLQGNFENLTPKRLIHLIVDSQFSWEVYENNIAVRTQWLKDADYLNLRIQYEQGIELKSVPSFESYTFHLTDEIRYKLDYYIKFSDVSYQLSWLELGFDGLFHELFFMRDNYLLNLNWSTSYSLEHYSLAIEFCEYIKNTIDPKIIPFCQKKTYGIEGELWYEPLEKQRLSGESRDFLKRLITDYGIYTIVSQKIAHRQKVMLTNSIDYSSYLVLNNEASKQGFQLIFKDLR